MHQFWSKGYQHTSMHDLLAAMNLSKGSLYQAFGSMRQLFRQCVGRYADQFAAQLRHALYILPAEPWAKRVSGVLVNDLARGADRAYALLTLGWVRIDHQPKMSLVR